MKAASIRLAVASIALAIIAACGGGGGGGTAAKATLAGRVLSIETGSATNPKSKVQVGSASVVTEDNGAFELEVPEGTSSASVDTLSAWGTFAFTFPAAKGITEVADWWVGPNKISVAGRIVSSADGSPVEGASVEFAGRRTTTAANGRFTLTNVAYSSTTQTVFWGIAGNVSATGYFSTQFSTQPKTPIAGVVSIDDVAMTPSSDIDPPPTPSNIWGRISPVLEAPGAIATLKESGTPVRVFVVGNDSTYRFWVPPGSYTIEVQKGSLTANATATLTAPDQVIRRDVTLN